MQVHVAVANMTNEPLDLLSRTAQNGAAWVHQPPDSLPSITAPEGAFSPEMAARRFRGNDPGRLTVDLPAPASIAIVTYEMRVHGKSVRVTITIKAAPAVTVMIFPPDFRAVVHNNGPDFTINLKPN